MRTYFLTINTYSNTTKLGKLVADIIVPRYDNTVVTDEQLLKIPDEITELVYRESIRNFRLKPMDIGVCGFSSGIANVAMTKIADNASIWIYSSISGDNDNRPFTIHATRIRKDYTIPEAGKSVKFQMPKGAIARIYIPKKKGGDK